MKKETFPKGTTVSGSKGLMTPSGPKPFVHVNRQAEFYRSYPKWRSRNPRTNHVYEFNGRLMHGNDIMEIIKSNMPSTSRASSSRSTRASTTSRAPSPPTRRMTTRSMTRPRSSPSSTGSTRRPATTQRRTRRKQSHPKRSHLN